MSEGEKDREKRVFQVVWHQIRIRLELRWLLPTLLQLPWGAGEGGRTASDISAGVQGAPRAGAGCSIFKGSSTGLQSQPENPN